MARVQHIVLLSTLASGFKYIEEKSFASTFQGLFSEINLHSKSLAKSPQTATQSSAPSSKRSPKVFRSSAPTPTFWAMPMNT
jgi:hypothetical protein